MTRIKIGFDKVTTNREWLQMRDSLMNNRFSEGFLLRVGDVLDEYAFMLRALENSVIVDTIKISSGYRKHGIILSKFDVNGMSLGVISSICLGLLV